VTSLPDLTVLKPNDSKITELNLLVEVLQEKVENLETNMNSLSNVISGKTLEIVLE
jgi:hypothetical protein